MNSIDLEQGTTVLGLHDHIIGAINFMAPYPFFYLLPTRRIFRHFSDHTGIINLPPRGVPKTPRGRDCISNQLLSLGLWACCMGTQTLVFSKLDARLPKVVARTLTTIACAPIRLAWTYLATSDEDEGDKVSLMTLFTTRRAQWQRYITTTVLCDNFDLAAGLCLKALSNALIPLSSDEELLSGEATASVSSFVRSAALTFPTGMLLWIPQTVISTCAANITLYRHSEVDSGWLRGVSKDIRMGLRSITSRLCLDLAKDYLPGYISVLGIVFAPMVAWVLFRAPL